LILACCFLRMLAIMNLICSFRASILFFTFTYWMSAFPLASDWRCKRFKLSLSLWSVPFYRSRFRPRNGLCSPCWSRVRALLAPRRTRISSLLRSRPLPFRWPHLVILIWVWYGVFYNNDTDICLC
jgi:hypothetical protein